MKTREGKLVDELRSLKIEVTKAQSLPGAYAFLPEIEASLDNMIQKAGAARSERAHMGGGLVRLVTESYAFSESDLGTQLLEVAGEFAER